MRCRDNFRVDLVGCVVSCRVSHLDKNDFLKVNYSTVDTTVNIENRAGGVATSKTFANEQKQDSVCR